MNNGNWTDGHTVKKAKNGSVLYIHEMNNEL